MLRHILLLISAVLLWSAAALNEPSSDGRAEYVGSTEVIVDLSLTHPVSDLLYGVFFEEIQHSGEGGIYAELIQDRSFEGLAWATGFLHSQQPHMPLQAEHFKAPQDQTAEKRELTRSKGMSQLRAEMEGAQGSQLRQRLQAQPKSWDALPGTQALLTRSDSLNADNPVAMRLVAGNQTGGIVNTGYWGIALGEGQSYHLSLWLKFAEAPEKGNTTVHVALESGDSQTTHASAVFTNVSTSHWHRYTANLTANATDQAAQLRISFPGPAELLVDVVSLFPLENVERGALNPYPFRDDLVQYVKDLKPRFLRIPGGCVIEGDTLALRFQWKKAVGPIAERPGHWDIWGYWNTDGLGMFEYLQMSDELEAIPIWVANNGVAHQDEVAPRDIGPWVQDALDSLEFAMGPADSKWGKVRASMGREEPWHIPYFAIGNEDCGPTHPFYLPNYVAFYFAIKLAYPHMNLIANCQLGQDAPVEMWDWHLYTNSWDMFKHRGDFDSQVPGKDPAIFASEYAVVDDSGFGNLKGALAEAAVMIGMERNSEVVRMAAYAPLLVNEHDHWYWTNLIGFNATQVFGIPSYHVQKVFSQVLGVRYASTQAASDMSLVHTERVAAGTTCQDEACTHLALKIVNTAGMRQEATVHLHHPDTRFLVHGEVNTTIITGQFAEVENSLDMPRNVYPRHEVLHITPEHTPQGATLRFSVPPISLMVLRIGLHYQTSPSEGSAASMTHLTLG